MHRRLKQFSYLFLYFLVLTSLGAGAYLSFFADAPNCFDAIQNQNETGIDCGGACIDCDLKSAKLQYVGSAEVLPAGRFKATVVAEIENTSKTYGVSRFEYTISVFSPFDTSLGTFTGVSSIRPGERKYLVVPAVSIDAPDIKRVSVSFANEEWRAEAEYPFATVRPENVRTAIGADDITVSGSMKNDSPQSTRPIIVTALLYSRSGDLIGASTAKMSGVEAFGSADFTVFFPRISDITGSLDTSKTRVLYESTDH